jgi:hypothetical protein
VATATVTFKAECYEIVDKIEASSYDAKEYWHWDAITSDKAIFETGYEIRDDPTTFYLPKFAPILSSGRDFHETCGLITYTIGDSDPSIFSNFAPIEPVATTRPSFTVWSEDPEKAALYHPFELYYTFALSAQFVLYPDIQGTYPINADDSYDLDFKVDFPCNGASFLNVEHYLWYKDPVGTLTKTVTDKLLEQSSLAEPVVY